MEFALELGINYIFKGKWMFFILVVTIIFVPLLSQKLYIPVIGQAFLQTTVNSDL
jgi:hypothetical protein